MHNVLLLHHKSKKIMKTHLQKFGKGFTILLFKVIMFCSFELF